MNIELTHLSSLGATCTHEARAMQAAFVNSEHFTDWMVVGGHDQSNHEEKMKRSFIVLATTALLAAGPVSAQNQPAQSGPNNSAVNNPEQNNSNAPVAGRNSFTEGQAKSKIEEAGYSNVTALKKDDDGVWRAKASKGGSSSSVSVDFQGNVNPTK
jgi:hypothetical protein